MNKDLVSRSHSQVRVWIHLSLKTKYTHKVFEWYPELREACKNIMLGIFEENRIEMSMIGFDDNHFHSIIDLGFNSVPDLLKKMKGTSGRKLLEMFPEVKKRCFYGSGFWSRTKYVYGIGRDMESMKKYISKQKFFLNRNQTKLPSFVVHATSL